MPARPNIFNVAPGRPFLETVARAILDGHLPTAGSAKPDPLDLPSMTILLPTRRAARALQEGFLKVTGGRAMLLPAIRPIAETEEEAGLIESFARGLDASEMLSLPPAVGKLERQLVLTELVAAWSSALRRAAADDEGDLSPAVAMPGAGTPAQSALLAHDLATLMDAVETENVSLAELSELVPQELSEHWQKTLDFLKIVTMYWPAKLNERGLLSPMDRRNQLILAEARRLTSHPPAAPVIIAGVTGSIPATAELMRAVLSLPNGAIVMPALDQGLDEASWQRLSGRTRSERSPMHAPARTPQQSAVQATIDQPHPEHPQFGFQMLLTRLGLTRADVAELPGEPLEPQRVARNRLISEAMRPAGSMEQWRTYVRNADMMTVAAALSGVNLIEAPTAEDEAETVALILREAAETPGRTAALVSPDRLLARRVAIRLESWGIRVDDSAGRPFGKTVPGTFLDLVVNAWEARFAPAELMALLKHPLTRLGLSAGDVRRTSRNLEVAAFRAPYLGNGLAALDTAVERAAHASTPDSTERRHATVRRMNDRDWAAVRDLVQRLTKAFAPLTEARQGTDDSKMLPLRVLAAAHVAAAEAIAAPFVEHSPEPVAAKNLDNRDQPQLFPEAEAADTVASPLWQGEAGEAAWMFFESLEDPALPETRLDPADYADFYRTLIAGETVRSRVPVHPRLSIWGPFEARLQQTDVMILGSLNEGTWPAAADPGAWLNRPMRQKLGLPSPEEEIGRAAHDLTTFFGAATVILTRADKVDGVPRVASRWLLRLDALLNGLGLGHALKPETPWLAWARARDHIAQLTPTASPEPRPPLELRPRRASVSDIETWVANPYAIFARKILRLDPLPAIGAVPGPQEKGQIIHLALSRFTERHPEKLPDDVVGAFIAAAAEVIRDYREEPRVRAFWLPRLQRFAEWFAASEAERRTGVTRLLAEVSAAHVLNVPGGPFTLSARADRIDVLAAGALVTDYKTGQLPGDPAVRSGAAPQLPLEAAMILEGAFKGLAPMPVAGLRYIRATGAEPPGEERLIKLKGGDWASLAASAMDGATRLITEFDDPATPFRALRRPRFKYEYDDYAHLARVGEWTADDSEEAA